MLIGHTVQMKKQIVYGKRNPGVPTKAVGVNIPQKLKDFCLNQIHADGVIVVDVLLFRQCTGNHIFIISGKKNKLLKKIFADPEHKTAIRCLWSTVFYPVGDSRGNNDNIAGNQIKGVLVNVHGGIAGQEKIKLIIIMSMRLHTGQIGIVIIEDFKMINAYAPTREYIRAAIEKIIGSSEFRGQYNDVVWCGRWDTRL